MDDQQLAQLRDWGQRLERYGKSPELRAAGRALDLATAEIDRLRSQVVAPEGRDAAPQSPARAPRRRLPFGVEAEEEDAEPLTRLSDRLLENSAAAVARQEGRSPSRRGRTGATAVAERIPPPVRPRRTEMTRAQPEGIVTAAAAERTEARRTRAKPIPAWNVPRPGRGTLIAAGVAATLLLAGWAALRVAAPDLSAEGPRSDAKIGKEARRSLSFAIRANEETLRKARWVLDAEDVTHRVVRQNGAARFSGAALPDGEHALTVTADGRLPGSRAQHSWRFTVDTSPPQVRLDQSTLKAPVLQPMRLAGSVDDGVAVAVAGRSVSVDDGRFSVGYPRPPTRPVSVVATDAFDNRTSMRVRVQLIPRRPRAPLRAVHVTFYAWADPELRRGILDLVDAGRVNAVELDLKDESGIVGFDAPIPFGRRIGSIQAVYDLPQAIDTLHRRGVMVVGRIVAFRDPIHAAAAWKRGWRSQVIQTPSGEPYAGYGGFTNFADPAVRRYNIDVARVAAAAGIDDVLYDYVRRPDGPIDGMRFPNFQGNLGRSIATFLGEARQALQPYGTFLGASVFGVAATRPTEVAQPIPAMARNVDYISPMLYPSHWGPGEYGVSYPNGEPYAIVQRSLRDFQRQVRGTGARVVPWLQDFSLGVTYGPAEVRAQIEGAKDAGIREWLLWDPLVTYTSEALSEARRLGPIPTSRGKAKAAAAESSPEPAAPPPPDSATAKAAAVRANELGDVPVLMYHQIRADGGGDYDLTPDEFRAELERLWREGYRPVKAVDLVRGELDLPAGKSPVVLTFDDSTKEQLAVDATDDVKPQTAIGIMLDFARTHPGFELAGTFYPNREPFAGVSEGPRLLRWLVEHGFELGNHTKDHIPFSEMSGEEARRQIVLGREVITDAVPEARVKTLALPLGAWPTPRSIAWRGTWNGQSYAHDGIFLVGAEPARSPFTHAFDPRAIPRIRTTPKGASDPEYGSSWWLDQLRRDPARRYVSDGDPKTIAFPRPLANTLAPRLRGRARPY
ncbi:MAG: polysaccharide deacetylase family protein [Actinobacteria bacterium]|nr:polysaccharide deacetylase family protein [Actinomycetota bacterium]